jgi:hypothetical protein
MPRTARTCSVSLQLREPLPFPSESTLAKGPLSERDKSGSNYSGDGCQWVSQQLGRRPGAARCLRLGISSFGDVGVGEIAAFEQKPRAMHFGAGVRQAIAEIEPGPVFAAVAVALEGNDRGMGRLLGNGHHRG